jgi:hypothetical protein
MRGSSTDPVVASPFCSHLRLGVAHVDAEHRAARLRATRCVRRAGEREHGHDSEDDNAGHGTVDPDRLRAWRQAVHGGARDECESHAQTDHKPFRGRHRCEGRPASAGVA